MNKEYIYIAVTILVLVTFVSIGIYIYSENQVSIETSTTTKAVSQSEKETTVKDKSKTLSVKVETVSSKKGVGLPKFYTFGKKQVNPKKTDRTTVERLNVGWYYNWSAKKPFETNAEFVPIVWGQNSFPESIEGKYVLGFNEPDHPCQSNLTVNRVLTAYNKLTPTMKLEIDLAAKRRVIKCSSSGGSVSKLASTKTPSSARIHVVSENDNISPWDRLERYKKLTGSPATASNVLKKGSWMRSFHSRASKRYDFITLHWYEGVNPNTFIKYLQNVYATFKKPIWITEYAPQTYGDSKQNPNKYTQSQIDNFIKVTSNWMNKTEYIHRYAWHNSYIGRCALFDADGELTETGKTYSAM